MYLTSILLNTQLFTENKNYTIDQMPDECWPIIVPGNDPIFTGSSAPKCLEFKRSQRTACRSARHGANFENNEIFNEVTHYIDGSNIYGSLERTLGDLRYGLHGVMDGQDEKVNFLLPDEERQCNETEESEPGFAAGDIRVNENPGLAAMHTLFAREHNRIASQIKAFARWTISRFVCRSLYSEKIF